MESFDLAVLGAGPGGYPTAIRAALGGLKVALIDEEVGGVCLNRGCIPSKALISSARLYHSLLHAKEMGIEVEGVTLNYPKMVERAKKIVEKMQKSLEGLIKAHGVTYFKAKGKLEGKGEISLSTGERLHAKNILIATGSFPRSLPLFPVDGKRVHDSTSLLQLKEIPKRFIVIGGGVIGCEFASLFANLGSEVTIVEMLPRLISTETEALSSFLEKSFQKRGIKQLLSQKVKEVKEGAVILESGEKLEADHILISVGRSVVTDQLGLEKVGVRLTKEGAIDVSPHMETSAPGIYAIGDVTGRYWLAHVATHQGAVALSHMTKGLLRLQKAIPSVIFTDPEIASIGVAEGPDIVTSEFPFLALGKAEAEGHTEGFVRLFADKKTGQILRAEVAGEGASTLIGEMTLAIANELTLDCVAETVHAHPTLPEAWMEASLIALGTPLHLPPRRSK